MIHILRAEERLSIGNGPFRLKRIRPGLTFSKGKDTGLGPLGLIDHALVQPGLVVAMHQHVNDEILSYPRQGSVIHEDTIGEKVELNNSNFMMMNAGSGVSHQETVNGNTWLEMLQIFVRPSAADLEPLVSFYRFPENISRNTWRLVAGPAAVDAPLTFRNEVTFYDLLLSSGERADTFDLETLTGFLYVFSGSLLLENSGVILSKGDGVIIAREQLRISATDEAQVVMFLVDLHADITRKGTLSG